MDISLPVTGGGLLLAGGYFLGKKLWDWSINKIESMDRGIMDANKRIADHEAECNKRAIQHARLEEQVLSMASNQARIEKKIDDGLEHVTKSHRVMDSKLDRILERG